MDVASPTGTARHDDLTTILGDLTEYLTPNPPTVSLPPAAFVSPELWELERDRIFHRSWLLVAHDSELSAVGDYVALTVAGEPVVVVRGADGLAALSPVCRHRSMPVVESGAGNTDGFTCPYHLWRYDLDGRLRGAPFMAGNPDFDAKNCRLPSFAVAQWGGFVWVNFDSSALPVGHQLAAAAEEFTNYQLDSLVPIDSWQLEWQANWKLVIENLHENYHVIGLHQQTLAPMSLPGGGDLDVRSYSPSAVRIRIPLAAAVPAESLELTETEQTNVMMLLTFPCGGLLAMADQVVWFSAIPTAVDRVQIRGGILTTPQQAVKPSTYADTVAALITINDEDRLGVEAIQRVVGSRYAERGHLSPKEAPGVLAFYRNLAHALVRQPQWIPQTA